MISFIQGVLASKQLPMVVIDVAGVGYELQTSMTTAYQLPAVGQPLKLLAHLSIREDAHVLYGFATDAERQLFRQLIKVSGIGPKLALTILSGIDVNGFHAAVESADTAVLVRLPGVGKKTAERLLLEMKGKLGATPALAVSKPATAAAPVASAVNEAAAALEALGFKAAEVERLLKKIDCDALSSEEIIRTALQASAK